ncbi:GNAT family N-acetyltransferase [Phyllobacterium myrsinacearum]|uniref:GNAT superfamily N-acetyltransferase n=1 Tax=Phyllobacterium myrsinacearum TaxID=28101 RepID=A0A839EVH1_9HYPH|nr:GNAT family N-acetyltransferase [Phyllobacterium myrsinacearum]MBA8882095.1 GNAT superfamily N-acetyltransferase [Phyllobacterium myrsinacearum]
MTDNWSRDITTRTGFTFHVRPACAQDEPALAEFFTHVTPEDRRFRFLSSAREVGHDRLIALTQIDHVRTENFLAFNPEEVIIATAMLACDDEMNRGEVAISVRSEDKHKGVGWELLGHLTRYAEAKGVGTLESIESRENHAAIELEREFGFVAEPYPDDSSLVIVRRQSSAG